MKAEEMQKGQLVQIHAMAYGYQPAIVNAVGDEQSYVQTAADGRLVLRLVHNAAIYAATPDRLLRCYRCALCGQPCMPHFLACPGCGWQKPPILDMQEASDA